MRCSNYWLLGIGLFVNGACGARTGDLYDSDDAGYFYTLGGSNGIGSTTAWTVGGANNAGGSPWAVGGWSYGGASYNPYGTGGNWYGVGGYNGCTASLGCPCYGGYYCDYPYSCNNGYCYATGVGGATYGGSTGCAQGTWGCSCYNGYYCDYPYSCQYGTCINIGGATGGASWGGASACSLGAWGCSCYAGNICNYPYTCQYGTCVYSQYTGGTTGCLTGSLGCPCYANGICASPYSCLNGTCGYVAAGGATSLGSGGRSSPMTVGGYTSYGGSFPMGGTLASTGGVSPVVACTGALATCVNDVGCAAVLSCLLNYTAKCSGDLTCYLLACESTITGSSAPLALQILQNCSSFIGL